MSNSKKEDRRRRAEERRGTKEGTLPVPDMSNVVELPPATETKDRPLIVRLGDLPDHIDVRNLPPGPIKPIETPVETPVVQEPPPPAPAPVAETTRDEPVIDDGKEQKMKTDNIAASLKALFVDAQSTMTERLKAERSAPEIVEILDEQIYPLLTQAKGDLQKAKDQRKTPSAITALQKVVENLQSAYQHARENPEVAEILDERATKEVSDQQKIAQKDRRARLDEMWSHIPEVDGKRDNNLDRVVESLQNPGDTDFFVISISPGTKVPSKPDANGRSTWTTTPKEGQTGFVLIQVTLDRIEDRTGREGPYKMPVRIAKVIQQVGEGLYFDKHYSYGMRDQGTFLFAPGRRYVSQPEFQGDDPFHPLKEALASTGRRLYMTRRQIEVLKSLTGDHTVTELIIGDKIGTAKCKVILRERTTGVDRPLEVALLRETKDSDLELLEWGPPSPSRYAPRLNALSGRQGGTFRFKVEEANVIPVEKDGEPVINEDGTPEVKCFVKLRVANDSWPKDEAGQPSKEGLRKAIVEQMPWLERFVRQALIDEYVASHVPDEQDEEEAAPSTDGVADHPEIEVVKQVAETDASTNGEASETSQAR